MAKKKIVYVDSDSDSGEDAGATTAPRPSFISGQVSRNLTNINRTFNIDVPRQMNSEFQKTKKTANKSKQIDATESGTSQEQSSKSTPQKGRKSTAQTSQVGNDDIICLSDSEEEPSTSKTSAAARGAPSQELILIDDDDDEPEIILETTSRRGKLTDTITKHDLTGQNGKSYEPMDIKMKRLNRIEYFTILSNQPISSIFDDISNKFDIPVPSIILYLNDSQVDPKSTPECLNVTVADIFDVLARSTGPTSQSTADSTANDPNYITLHLRDNTKKRTTFRVNRYQTVKDLVELYAKEKGVNADKVMLEFDSDHMALDKKIDHFDMENDDQIDVIIG